MSNIVDPEPRAFRILRHREQVCHFFDNLQRFWDCSVVYQLARVREHIPVAVIGAGPSLERSLPRLANMQDRFTIIATNAAVKNLIASGIRPHFVTGLEYRDQSKCFEGVSGLEQSLAVLMDFSHPSFFTPPFHHRFIATSGSFPLAGKILGPAVLPPFFVGGNVSSMALGLAVVLGARQVLLFGHDLAFKEGRKYAAGSGGTVQDDEDDHLTVPGVDGGTVQTSSAFRAYIELLGNAVAVMRKQDIDVFNVDSQGAFLQRCIHVDFDSWLMEHAPAPAPPFHELLDYEWPRMEIGDFPILVRRLADDLETLIRVALQPPFEDPENLGHNPMVACFSVDEWEDIRAGRADESHVDFLARIHKTLSTYIEEAGTEGATIDSSDPAYIRERERNKYEKVWRMEQYRTFSPGLAAYDKFNLIDLFRKHDVKTVLDAGCGSGKLLRKLRTDHGDELEAFGFDISANCLDPWFDPIKDEVLTVGCLWEPDDFNKPYDAIVCTDVLEHIPTEFVPAVLKNFRQCARRFCYLCIALVDDAFGKILGEPLHLTVASPEWWLARIREARFRVEEVRIERNTAGEALWLHAFLSVYVPLSQRKKRP